MFAEVPSHFDGKIVLQADLGAQFPKDQQIHTGAAPKLFKLGEV